MDIRDFKVVYITEEEADEICKCMHFCPAHYPLYDGCGRMILYDGEIGCCPCIETRLIINKGELMRICCSELQEEIRDGASSIAICDTYAGFGLYFVNNGEGFCISPVYKLNYCPFCGEKIEIKK